MNLLTKISTICFLLISLNVTSLMSQVQAGLKDKFTGNTYVDILVVLKDKAEISDIKNIRNKDLKAELVYKRLKAVATASQRDIVSHLMKENISYRSFCVVNALAVRADLRTYLWLANRQDVEAIYEDSPVKLVHYEESRPEHTPREPMPEWGVRMIGADSVWTMGYTGEGIVIGGQDTGYNWDVSPLKNKYRGYIDESNVDHNYNWHDAITEISPLHNDTLVFPELNPCGLKTKTPCDDNNHGTHTMGTMVGSDEDNLIGVAPDAVWIGCRNMERGYGTPSTYIECFEWFLAPTDLDGNNPDPSKAPDVINNSWGCPEMEGCNSDNWEIMNEVVRNLKTAGVVVVVSAGNSGPSCSTVNSPAAMFGESFTVGATRQNDTIANFSSRGPVAVDGSFRLKPDVSAPGVAVRSVVRNGSFRSFNGTSMAGPHVAGAVALIISANPALRGQVDLIEQILMQTADAKTTEQNCGEYPGSEVPNPVYGFGRINVVKAVEEALKYTSIIDLASIDIKLFPNPANTEITFAADTELVGNINIFDATGRLILSDKIANQSIKKLDISALQQGIYYIRFQNHRVSFAKTFIKI